MSALGPGGERRARPPRLAIKLLSVVLPVDVRDGVIGDVTQVFEGVHAERGGLASGLWFWGQTLSLSVRFVAERVRDGLGGLGGGLLPSWIDVRLGVRMLVRTPLLTVTGCVAIATAIGINAGFNDFVENAMSSLPRVPDDDGVVGLVNEDVASGRRVVRLDDLARWRRMETLDLIGALLTAELNLVGPDGRSTPVSVAEVTASTFELLGAVPELGRLLQDSDEGPAAEPVAVLGHDLWQNVLGGDPLAIGSVVRLGETSYTVVGVAPPDFSFPTDQEAWTNVRVDVAALVPGTGPGATIFGRLASGRRVEEAQAEIETLQAAAAADDPETFGQLRARVLPFDEAFGLGQDPMVRWALRGARLLFALLLVAACANVATLVFARNAARESEIAVRSALGAGRPRIVSQLFAEATVLSLLSAAVGLIAAAWALRYGSDVFWDVQRMEPPPWWDSSLSASTVLYSFALAMLGAGIVGILPGLRATKADPQELLRRAGSGSGSLSFGRLPTAVVVVQVAVSVALLPTVLTGSVAEFQRGLGEPTFPTDRYLTGRLLVDTEVQRAALAEERARGGEVRYVTIAGVADRYAFTDALLERYRSMRERVAQRLRAEPGIRGMAFTTRLPP